MGFGLGAVAEKHYFCSAPTKGEKKMSKEVSPIGVFDSGYGGLTILKDIRAALPEYDFLYLGDNARAPYGPRSFEVVYEFTLQAVRYLFSKGCKLVILACNTASAKALRSIQQNDLPLIDPTRRVLGVIRPTVERLAALTATGSIGVLGTAGTIQSGSYDIEIAKMHPTFRTFGHACPLWAALVEARETSCPGTEYFVQKDLEALLAMNADIDTIILACTHYPLLSQLIEKHLPSHISLVNQGPIVAESLADYLRRHPELETRLSKNASCSFLTTENAAKFGDLASVFLGAPVQATHVTL